MTIRSGCFHLISAVLAIFFYFSVPPSASYAQPFEMLKEGKKLVIPHGISVGDLPDKDSKGAKLFATYCNRCHNLPNPKMYSNEEWPSMFERMMDHVQVLSGVKEDVKAPAGKDREEIVEYLKKAGFKAYHYNATSFKGEDAFLFVWFCSTCHSLPDPAYHSPKEWAAVVGRMAEHRKKENREDMTASEREKVISFLSKKK